MDVWTVVISSVSAVVAALIGAAGGQWYLRRSQRRKVDAEAEKITAEAKDIITGTALKLVKQLEATVQGLEQDVCALRCEVTSKDEQIAALETRVRELEAIVCELETQRVQDRNKIRYWSGRTTHLTKGVKLLTAQMEALGLTPEWVNGGEPLAQPVEDGAELPEPVVQPEQG